MVKVPGPLRAPRGIAKWMLFPLGVVIGTSLGVWFATHYRVVPIDAPVSPIAPDIAKGTVAGDPALTKPQPNSPSVPAGPYAFKFTPEELVYYRLDTTISGQGADSGMASDVYLNLTGDYSLYTKAVDQSGTADLRLLFDDVAMQGNFLGSPFEMGFSKDRTYIYDGRTTVDTARGGSVNGIPQLDFFKQPISMRVGSNGQVLDVKGPEGIAGMLATIPALARVEFPNHEMPEGNQWVSRINLPIPGLGSAVDTSITNTLVGYQYVGTHYCGVIRQDFGASQKDGTLNSPESTLGPSMQFSVPLFDLSGQNMVYFDVTNGRLVHTVLDLKLAMNIGSALGSTAGILGQLGQGILGGGMEGLGDLGQSQDHQPSLIDLSLGIQGAITLVDPSLQSPAPQ